MDLSHCVFPSLSGEAFVRFCPSAIETSAAVNIHVHIFVRMPAFSSLGIYLAVELLADMVAVVSVGGTGHQ